VLLSEIHTAPESILIHDNIEIVENWHYLHVVYKSHLFRYTEMQVLLLGMVLGLVLGLVLVLVLGTVLGMVLGLVLVETVLCEQ
jgi:hypothetical protein